MLYQRYFLRMNQANAVHIVWLLFGLVFLLTFIHLYFTVYISEQCMSNLNNESASTEQTATKEESGGELFLNYGDLEQNQTLLNSSSNANSSDKADSWSEKVIKHGRDANYACQQDIWQILSSNSLQLTMLGLCTVLYSILLLCLYKQHINEIYLFHVSYAIIISLVAIDISFSVTPQGK